MKMARKKLGAWLLTLAMLLSLIPAVYAEEAYAVFVTPDKTQVQVGETVKFSAEVTRNSEELESLGDLSLWFWADTWAEGHEDGKKSIDLSDNSGKVFVTNITFREAGTFYVAAELKNGDTRLAVTYVELTVTDPEGGNTPGPVEPGKRPNDPVTPSEHTPVQAGISVPYVAGSESAFIRGADVSSLLSILNSGARFKNWDGNSLGSTVDAQGKAFMKLLADSGVNWIRLRVWNDPFNASGKGYGGGNNDLNAAVTMGKWATEAGMKVLIDFHYSDFWADPGKQKAPKAWAAYTVDQKAEAITKFTTDSLNTLLNAGVDVGMVQVGNETNNNICGVATTSTDGGKLFDAGCDAVHAVAKSHNREILAAVHFADPQKGNYATYAKSLDDNNVSYDVFASSYYPYWHGTTQNLTSQLKHVADTYGKYVMVAETSWATTLVDGDGHDNTVRVGSNDETPAYPFSVQGQATEVASVMQAVTNVGTLGIGAFYWEPAWIPVVDVSNLEGDAKTVQINKNKALWEEHGSGWAASYSSEYDPDDAGRWAGGSAVDNQAVFDFTGKPLESLNVFKYVTTGTISENVTIETVEELSLTLEAGSALTLPATATVTNSLGEEAALPVTWDEGDRGTVDMNVPGTYTIAGTVSGRVGGVSADGLTTTCTVVVKAKNLLNNPGFEEGNTKYTPTESWAGKGITDQEAGNAHDGSYCLHFYSEAGAEMGFAHEAVTLSAGSYEFTLYAQGSGATGDIYVKDAENNELGKASLSFNGWKEWSTPVVRFTLTKETAVTVGAAISVQAGGWGAFDDLYLGVYSSTVAAPKASPNGGSFSNNQIVKLTCATEGAVIYYTTDGSIPTAGSTKYAGPITLTGSATIKAIAVKDGMTDSAVLTAVFTKNSGGSGNSGGSSSSGSSDSSGNSSGSSTSDNSVSTSTAVEGGVPTAETLAAPTASVKDGTASASVSASMGNEIVKQAVASKSGNVVIAPKITGNVNKTEISIPASAISEIGSKTNASLTVSTPVTNVTIPNGALSGLSRSGEPITIAAERSGNTVEVAVKTGDKAVKNIPGGLSVTVPAIRTTPGTVAVLIHEDGTREVVRKSVAEKDSVTIPLDGSAKLEIVDNSKQFADVPAGNWAASAVAFASAHELFNGTAADRFSPDLPMSRGMLAVVLHNLERNPKQEITGTFADVNHNEWYAEGVAWATANGIVSGYSSGTFGPNDDITREQLAVMLWRYAGSPSTVHEELYFADAGQISDWALEAMHWAVENGVINGKGGGILDPGGKATRAQAAQMIKSFMEQ